MWPERTVYCCKYSQPSRENNCLQRMYVSAYHKCVDTVHFLMFSFWFYGSNLVVQIWRELVKVHVLYFLFCHRKKQLELRDSRLDVSVMPPNIWYDTYRRKVVMILDTRCQYFVLANCPNLQHKIISSCINVDTFHPLKQMGMQVIHNVMSFWHPTMMENNLNRELRLTWFCCYNNTEDGPNILLKISSVQCKWVISCFVATNMAGKIPDVLWQI